jgi:hypothetical protein
LIQQDGPSFARPRPSPDELLKGLAAAEVRVAGRLQTAELERALEESLRERWAGNAKASNNDQLVLEALSDERKLGLRIGDDSNLTLDTDLDSYYVQNIVVDRLPALVSQLGETQMCSARPKL